MQLSNNEISAPKRALRPPAVLIVEDNEEARGQMAGLLRGHGFDVTEASDGKEALGKLRGGAGIDLVLLDLWLPIMDGWSFRAQQRAERALSEIPVVVITADDSAQARTIHANAVLRKPFGVETLCRTIRQVLAEKEAELKGSALLLSETLSLIAGAMGHEIGNRRPQSHHGERAGCGRARKRHRGNGRSVPAHRQFAAYPEGTPLPALDPR